MKIKLFSHTDLDGISCGILAKLAFEESADISYCNYDKINEEVAQFLNEGQYQLFDQVYITDISVNETAAAKINELYEEGKLNIKLFDHHPTAEWLNKFKWSTVYNMIGDNHKTSGTSMFFDYLVNNRHLAPNFSNKKFVELVRQYDSWQWAETNNLEAKQLNDLLYILGRERFIEEYLIVLDNDTFYGFSKSEKLLLELEQEKIDRYIKSKTKQLYSMNVQGYSVGVVFAEQYQSQLGNELSNMNSELDFIAMINMGNKTVSYRTIKDDVHLGEFAKQFNGGGHAKAAGSQFDDTILKLTIGYLFADDSK